MCLLGVQRDFTGELASLVTILVMESEDPAPVPVISLVHSTGLVMVMDWLVATGIQVLVDGPGILTGYGPQIPDFVTVAGGTEESKIMPISSRVYVLGYPEHLFPVVWHEKMSVHAVTFLFGIAEVLSSPALPVTDALLSPKLGSSRTFIVLASFHFVGRLPVTEVPSAAMTEKRVFVVSLLPVTSRGGLFATASTAIGTIYVGVSTERTA